MSDNQQLSRASVLISGRVQGVFFRLETQREAQRCGGITGWVKNQRDGTVRAVFEGEKQRVNSMLDWCRLGPPESAVLHLDVSWEPYTGEFDSFEIRY
jgi:acylphosphatase